MIGNKSKGFKYKILKLIFKLFNYDNMIILRFAPHAENNDSKITQLCIERSEFIRTFRYKQILTCPKYHFSLIKLIIVPNHFKVNH